MKNKSVVLLSLLLVGFLFSCENINKQQVLFNGEAIAQDEIISLKTGEIGEEDAQPALIACGGPGFGMYMRNHRFDQDCMTLTSSGADFPKEIIIDYGEGCEGRHGEIRLGKIIISMSADIREAGAVYETRYEGISMGGRQIELLKTTKNLGQNEAGNWLIETALNQTISYEDGSTSTRIQTGVNEWISGFETLERDDDVFLKTGSGSVVTSEGAEYSRIITTALLVDRSCLYIKSGVVVMNRDGQEVIIDFGDGECDEWATVTTDGNSELIDLSERGRGRHMRGFRQ